jgi:hypothetical protein
MYEGPSPRTSLAAGAYTASEVSGAMVVPEHAEMSYLPHMPRHLFFWCRQPATWGGQTTLADGRNILADLKRPRFAPLVSGPLRIRRRHARPEGWHDPFELKRWHELFGTRDRQQVVARARGLALSALFESDGALTLEGSQDAVRVHPETHERAWLNHLLVFHASAPAALLREALRYGEPRAAALLPSAWGYRELMRRLGRQTATDVRLPDGSPIDDALVNDVRAVVARHTRPVSWQRGDLLLVDNHLVMHGRRPFRGARDVVVAWSDARF